MTNKHPIGENRKSKVLIADDEAVIRMGLKTMVTTLGYRVVGTAVNGDDALEKVKTLQPDLLLLDIKMPGKDGLTVAEILATEMPLPIIMLTAYTDQTLIERAANAAVMGYLVKPIHEAKLGPMIEVALTRFEDMCLVAREVYQLRNQLESRNLIDAAKRILVAAGLSEAEAYRRLQMTAREKRRPMRQVAEAVIAVGQKFAV
ncbi:MAG: response regulator [Anaerolineae bacterium]|nr:response regulator [Anaerolineae bacterium]